MDPLNHRSSPSLPTGKFATLHSAVPVQCLMMGRNISHRRKYREQSHQKSHAGGEISPVLEGNPLIPTGESQWVDTNEGVVSICKLLKSAGTFTFDTEFIGEDSYFSKTCLVQVGTSEMVALIDPFEVTDLSPLFDLIADPGCTKVVHAGKQDFEPLIRLHDKPPAAVFDTQIAAGLVGFPWPVSLTKLIEALLSHDVGGHFTLTQWDERPLTKRQKIYAADDVRYLLALHDLIGKRLEELGRHDWIEEECKALTATDAFGFDVKTVVKRLCKNKTPRKKDLLRIQALVSLRDAIAQEQNEPPRSVIPDDCILSLSRHPVNTIDQLASMRGFPKRIAHQYGKSVLACIEEAQSLTPIALRKPQPVEREAKTRHELDGLWSLFCAWCVGNELSSGLVASRATFTDWCLAIRSNEQPPDSPMTRGWRSTLLIPFAAFLQGTNQLEFQRTTFLQARVKE